MREKRAKKLGSLCVFIGGNMSLVDDELYANPLVMAIKDVKDLKECMKDDYEANKIVFVLFGNIETIPTIVDKLKSLGKVVFVHENLIEGLSSSTMSSIFIKKYTKADGIITTRAQNAAYARKIGLMSVLRFFILDSLSYQNVKDTIKKSSCDFIEILPGIMPKIIEEITRWSQTPLIAGGLIREKTDVMAAISAGAVGVSSSNKNVWKM